MQNDMRDRLIKLLKTPNKSAILRKANPQFVTEETDEESIVADYLIANGVIVPPCKVGETVHYITYYKNKYDYHYIINVSLDILFQLFHEKEIGYVIYMTDDKSKAEQKLKELNG